MKYGIIQNRQIHNNDIKFSTKDLEHICTSELANLYGNFLKRIITLCIKYNDGKVPNTNQTFDISYIENINKSQNLNTILSKIVDELHSLNSWLTIEKPWITHNLNHIHLGLEKL